jgi:hypothetical protein
VALWRAIFFPGHGDQIGAGEARGLLRDFDPDPEIAPFVEYIERALARLAAEDLVCLARLGGLQHLRGVVRSLADLGVLGEDESIHRLGGPETGEEPGGEECEKAYVAQQHAVIP